MFQRYHVGKNLAVAARLGLHSPSLPNNVMHRRQVLCLNGIRMSRLYWAPGGAGQDGSKEAT
jgi:hypothetical protein